VAILFKIVRNGNDFSATANGGAQFFVGRRVPYKGNVGLYNVFGGSNLQKLNYSAAEFAKLGFWAEFLEPTAICEGGGNYLTVNSYDRAAFTFGFGQFAAHVPNGDFVKYFRNMLSLATAADYFPHLGVVGGRICKTDGSQPRPLESDDSTAALMTYLNPGLDEVQDAEVIAAAKLIHWTASSTDARHAQVSEMASTYRRFMARADNRVGIDGLTADKCCVIADILHQGRGGEMTWPLIDDALRSSKPFENLIAIGAPEYDGRKKTLKKEIEARPNFKARSWSRAKGDFV
jgi:hypothetical protein